MKKHFLYLALILCVSGIAQPTISSFSPTSGAVGAGITITGTGFSSVASDNIVFFGGVRATVNTASATSLNVIVPVGAGYQPISVTNNRLTVYSKTPFNVTFTGAATPITNASFTATNIASTRHEAVIFADIDGDGKPDMITTNKTDSTISVYRNTSTGGGVSFESKLDFKIGSRPRFIVAGDVNGDGKQDIISANISIANTEDASFTVLINKSVTGQVSMTAQKKNISRGTFPGMSFGDFDLDGKPDVALASMDSSQLVIYGNASSADSVKFNTEKKISLPFPPEYIINADLDGDGKTDLLLSKSGDSSLYVARNTSTPGVFSFATPLNIGFASLSMSYNPFAIADFNNDGKPDVAFPNLYTGKVMVFKNTSTSGDISFNGVSNFPVGSKPLTLAAADLTGDGLPDLIVNNTVSATMSVLKNTSSAGSFAFDTKFDFPVSNTGYSSDGIAAIADIDLNGAYDFVGYNATVNGFLVYQNKMLSSLLVSSFTPTTGKQGDTITIRGKAFATTSEVRFGGVAAASFTIVSDSLIKAVVGNGKSGAVRVTATIGTDSLAGFTFTIPKPKINSLTPPSGTTGDLISIGGSGFTGTTAVSFGETPATSFTIVSDSLIKAVVGTGGNGAVRVTTPGGYDSLLAFVFLPSNTPKIIAIAPLSGTVNSTVTITGNNFSTTPANNIVYFGAVKATVTAATVTSLTVKVPVAGSYLPVSVTVNGYTGFSKTPFNISFSGNGQELTRADLFLRKQGDSTLNKSFIEDVFSHDLDGDGKVDVVAIIWNGEGQNNGPWTTNTGAILVGRNTGSIGNPSFSAQQIISTGLKPSEVNFADIDGDGKTDILTANQNDNTISILRNTSTPGTISFEAKKDFTINSNNPLVSAQRNSVATGDLNNDGKPDIVAAVGNNSTFSIFTNTSTPGTISFATRIDIDRPLSTVSSPVSIVITDFNSDNKADVAFSNANNNFISVYKNITPIPGNTPIALGVKQDISVNSSNYRIAADDLDNDGKPDIISADNNSSFLRILRNTSSIDSIIFADPVAIETGTPSTLFALNNFDGNGKADIAIGRVNTDSLILLQNTSIPGTISFTKYRYKTNKGDNFVSRITSADFDGDGLQDLATKNLISLVPGSGYNTFFIDVILNRFSAGPAVISFTPKTGGTNTSVTIKGAKFSGTTAVYFGTDTAKSFTVVSDSVITAIIGNGASGYVKVKAPAGTDSLAGFTFLPPATPKMISFSPLSAGPGNTVAIKGQNLTGTTVVSFGGISATSFTIVSDSLVNAVVGATGASGLVRITTSTGKDSLAGFTFLSGAPKINSFTPTSGKTGDTISIKGSRFTGAGSVSFGNNSAASFTIASDSLIKAVVGTGGSGFVKITTPSGTDSLAGFTFLSGPPKINSFTPSSGTTGDTISIKGSRFSAATEIRFGIYPAGFTVISDSLVKAVLGNGGSGSVKLSTLAGTDSLAGFVFISSIPKISSFTPSSGTNGDTISIKGTKLTGTILVHFGNTAAKTFSVVSDSLIKAVVGSGASGFIRIQNQAGFDSASGFTYTTPTAIPKITSFSPLTGTTGTKVTITGKNLFSVTSVSFGNTTAGFTANNDTSITATVGSGASGFVKISGTSGKDSLSGFVYTAPIQLPKINSFTPGSGTSSTAVAIKGRGLTGATAVSFGGIPAQLFTVVSDSLINAIVGVSGASGYVVVKTPTGSDSLQGFVFVNTNAEINIDTTKNHLSFSAVKGGYSPSQSFVFSALRLITDVTVLCPYPFTVSRNPDTGFTSLITIPAVNGKIDSAKVYVRFKGDDTVILLSNALTLSAGGAIGKNVFLAGSICDSSILQVPVVNAFTKDTTLCIRDSLVLSPATNYTKYRWSTGDSTKTITVKKSASISLQVGPKAGCFSPSSAVLKIVKDSNAIPVLALINDTTLLSSSAPNYRWYFNNNLIAGNTSSKLVVKKIGFYGVETSNDKICWSSSNDFPIVLLPAPLVNDSVSIKSYPNPATGGSFNVVVTLQRPTNVVTRVTVTDAAGLVLLQTNKFIFFGREIKIPITLNAAAKGTVFIKVDINGDIKTQTVILQ